MGSRYKGQKQVDTISAQGETLMEFALYDAIKIGIVKFVFIINDQFPSDYQTKIERLLIDKGCKVHFVIQTLEKFIPKNFQSKIRDRKKPLGTAHAVYCAKEIIDGLLSQ